MKRNFLKYVRPYGKSKQPIYDATIHVIKKHGNVNATVYSYNYRKATKDEINRQLICNLQMIGNEILYREYFLVKRISVYQNVEILSEISIEIEV